MSSAANATSIKALWNCIPSVDRLVNIAIFLNISVDELIGLTEQVRKNCAMIAQFEEK